LFRITFILNLFTALLSKSHFREGVCRIVPWAPSEPTVNLARICERYGGGAMHGGAISFDVTQHDAARKAAAEIVEELRTKVRQGI
jgi:hypothetical protein